MELTAQESWECIVMIKSANHAAKQINEMIPPIQRFATTLYPLGLRHSKNITPDTKATNAGAIMT